MVPNRRHRACPRPSDARGGGEDGPRNGFDGIRRTPHRPLANRRYPFSRGCRMSASCEACLKNCGTMPATTRSTSGTRPRGQTAGTRPRGQTAVRGWLLLRQRRHPGPHLADPGAVPPDQGRPRAGVGTAADWQQARAAPAVAHHVGLAQPTSAVVRPGGRL